MKSPVIAGCKLWLGNKRKRQAKKKVKWFTDNIKKVQQASNYEGIKYTEYNRGYLCWVYLGVNGFTYIWNRYQNHKDRSLTELYWLLGIEEIT